jgi:hypothetical protein
MSRFDALKKAKQSPENHTSSIVAAAENLPIPTSLKRRGNQQYKQFSAYIPLPMYRRLKAHLGATGVELSVAVEQALSDWMEKRGA